MKRLSFIAFPIIVTSLSACSVLAPTPSVKPTEPGQPAEGDGYKQINEFSFNIHDVQKSRNIINLQSVGDAKILVVPVTAKNGTTWTNQMLLKTEKVFFGAESDTGWQSVASFYKTSSYGKLNISGELASPLISQYTISELSEHKIDGSPRPDDLIRSEFESSNQYKDLRQKYDTNKDGYIDAVVFIYSNEINSSQGYWAWVTNGQGASSVELPSVNSYVWVSYNFVCSNQTDKGHPYAAYGEKVDAHTVIHETGHLLGINDYYCYDNGENDWDPSGKIEMHSNNIGDENIYSKLAMGWVNPYYVKTTKDKPVTLKLRSSAGYGDAVIINDTWNNSICDEYIVLEYYTPNGLNNKDAVSPYAGNSYQMYTNSGFRIYHIDARIAKLNVRGGMEKYVDSLEPNCYYSIAASNSPSFSRLSGEEKDLFKECHLIEANGENTFKKHKTYASNITLFGPKTKFNATSDFFRYNDTFNEGGAVGYTIDIGNCDDSYGTITITKL